MNAKNCFFVDGFSYFSLSFLISEAKFLMKNLLGIAAIIISISYAFHVFIEMRELNLNATRTVILCAESYDGKGYDICKEHSLKYGIFNIDGEI